MTAVGSPTSGNVAVSMTTGWTGTAPQAGDQLVAYVMTDDGGATIGAPSGWSSIAQVATGADIVSRLLWLADATGIASSVNFPVSGTQGSKVLVVAINPNGETLSGTGTPEIAATVNSTTATTPVEAGVANPSIRLSFFADDSSFTVSGAPAGMTLLALNNANACSLVGYYAIDDGTGDKQDTVTWSGLDGVSAGIIILQYAAGGSSFDASFAASVPLQSLAATVGVTAPTYGASFAASVPIASLAASVSHVPPTFDGSFTATLPLQSLAAVVDYTEPGAVTASFAAAVPIQTLAATVAHVRPTFTASYAGSLPLQVLDADVSTEAPVFDAAFAGTLPVQTLAAEVAGDAPGFEVSFAGTIPMARMLVPGPDIDFAVTLYIRRDLSGTEAVRLDYASTETIRQNLASQELV